MHVRATCGPERACWRRFYLPISRLLFLFISYSLDIYLASNLYKKYYFYRFLYLFSLFLLHLMFFLFYAACTHVSFPSKLYVRTFIKVVTCVREGNASPHHHTYTRQPAILLNSSASLPRRIKTYFIGHLLCDHLCVGEEANRSNATN